MLRYGHTLNRETIGSQQANKVDVTWEKGRKASMQSVSYL